MVCSRVIFFMLLHLFISIPILSQDEGGDYDDYVDDPIDDTFFYAQENPGQEGVTQPVVPPVAPVGTAPVAPEPTTIISPIVTPVVPAVPQTAVPVAPVVTPAVASPVTQPAGPAVPQTAVPVAVAPVVTPAVASAVTQPVAPQNVVPVATAPGTPPVTPSTPLQNTLVEDIQELEGIDTVDVNEPEGNWLFKRIWWEKSKDLFGKIRDHVDKIVESRMHFFEQRVKLDRNLLDPFYVNVGLEQGELTEIINYLFELIKAKTNDVESLSGQELERYNLLVEEKSNLEKLRVSVIDIQTLNGGLDEALKNLMEQINRTRSYEREAWALLNQIAEELSDKKAREHYYEIATIWRNVKDIGNYIVGPFSMHFVELGDALIKRVQEVQTSMIALKEKGVEFSKEIQQEHEAESKVDHDEDEDYVEPVKVGWLRWFWQKLTAPFSWIWHKIIGLFGW